MEHRNFDVKRPKGLSEKRKKVQELRAMHHFSYQLEAATGQTSGTTETSQRATNPPEPSSSEPASRVDPVTITSQNPRWYKNLSRREKIEEFFKSPHALDKIKKKILQQEQKQGIVDKFIDHCQPAKEVYDRLAPFLDDYQRCQEDLKRPDLSIGQLQAMHS